MGQTLPNPAAFVQLKISIDKRINHASDAEVRQCSRMNTNGGCQNDARFPWICPWSDFGACRRTPLVQFWPRASGSRRSSVSPGTVDRRDSASCADRTGTGQHIACACRWRHDDGWSAGLPGSVRRLSWLSWQVLVLRRSYVSRCAPVVGKTLRQRCGGRKRRPSGRDLLEGVERHSADGNAGLQKVADRYPDVAGKHSACRGR